MRLQRLIFLVSICVSTGLAVAPARASSSESYDHLDSLATLAMSASDGNKHCGLSSADALRIMPLLHGALDEARQREIKAADARKAATLRPWLKCQAECHCGAWADLADSLGKHGPSVVTKKALREKASIQSPKSTQRCAKAAESWACSSELLRELRAEAK